MTDDNRPKTVPSHYINTCCTFAGDTENGYPITYPHWQKPCFNPLFHPCYTAKGQPIHTVRCNPTGSLDLPLSFNPASIVPGFITRAEYHNLIGNPPSFRDSDRQEPSSEALDESAWSNKHSIAEELKAIHKELKEIKTLIIHRLYANMPHTTTPTIPQNDTECPQEEPPAP